MKVTVDRSVKVKLVMSVEEVQRLYVLVNRGMSVTTDTVSDDHVLIENLTDAIRKGTMA